MDFSPETPFQRAKADGLSWKMTLTLAAPCAEQGHRLPPNESTARGCEAGTKISIVESSIRGRLKISGRCLGKTFVAHGPCGHEVPELLQGEKKEPPCVCGWSTQSLPGTGRNSPVPPRASRGLSSTHGAAGADSTSSAPTAASARLLRAGTDGQQQRDGKEYCYAQMKYHKISLLPAGKHQLLIRKPLKIYMTC